MEHMLPPSEIEQLARQILSALDRQMLPPAQLAGLEEALANFSGRWQAGFARFGHDPAGELAYRDAWLFFVEQVAPLARPWLAGHPQALQALSSLEALFATAPPQRFNRQLLAQVRQQRRQYTPTAEPAEPPVFDRPLFIVSAPRAGSTLLFETLTRFGEIWTIGRESHDLESAIPLLHPATHHYHSNRLTTAEATAEVSLAVQRWFSRRLYDRAGMQYHSLPAVQRPQAVRFLEKTPKNALRIPWLRAVFPGARFIFLYREPRQNISSLLEGWRVRRFVAYREMPGWPYKEWSFLLIPGWQRLVDRPLVEIAACQWCAANQQIMDDLQHENDWLFLTYQQLIERPAETIRQISQFAGLRMDELVEQTTSAGLPLSQMVISPPSTEKWRQHEAEITTILPLVEPVIRQITAFRERAEPSHTNLSLAE